MTVYGSCIDGIRDSLILFIDGKCHPITFTTNRYSEFDYVHFVRTSEITNCSKFRLDYFPEYHDGRVNREMKRTDR